MTQTLDLFKYSLGYEGIQLLMTTYGYRVNRFLIVILKLMMGHSNYSDIRQVIVQTVLFKSLQRNVYI